MGVTQEYLGGWGSAVTLQPSKTMRAKRERKGLQFILYNLLLLLCFCALQCCRDRQQDEEEEAAAVATPLQGMQKWIDMLEKPSKSNETTNCIRLA